MPSITTTTTTPSLYLLLLLLLLLPLLLTEVKASNDECSLSSRMVLPNFRDRLHDLEDIARENSGNRAAGTSGYQHSVDYITGVLEKHTNYSVSVQSFPYDDWELTSVPVLNELSPTRTVFQYYQEFRVMRGSVFMGQFKGRVVAAMGLGCKSTDYPQDIKGAIALVERGDCIFEVKVQEAIKAGAAAVIIFNTVGGLPLGSEVGTVPIPVLSVSHVIGQAFLEVPELVLEIKMTSTSERKETYNVIADMPGGDPNNIMVIGSHLDSVPAGPGINDNGSGTITNLEIALAFSSCLADPKLGVRFAWWGAEELGLLGSIHYVDNLRKNHPDELKKIALNINLDMIASPNFVYLIYNGITAPEPIRKDSAYIQTLFQKSMEKMGKSHRPTAFDGRSDYGPFIENGIPAGGIYSGAEGVKDIALRNVFGGIANTEFDPCYHNKCDDYGNVNEESLMVFAKATAAVVESLATSFSSRFTSNERVIYETPLYYDKDETFGRHSR